MFSTIKEMIDVFKIRTISSEQGFTKQEGRLFTMIHSITYQGEKGIEIFSDPKVQEKKYKEIKIYAHSTEMIEDIKRMFTDTAFRNKYYNNYSEIIIPILKSEKISIIRIISEMKRS